MERQPDWIEIETAFRGGIRPTEIRARFGVSLRELFVQAKARDWKHGERGATPPNGPEDESPAAGEPEMHLPALIDATTARVIDEVVEEAVSDIVREHKGISRKLRRRFDAALEEFDELARYAATFMDATRITELAAKGDGGKELREYLTKCLASYAKRTDVLEKLGRIGGQIVNIERAVWSLGATSDGASAQSAEEMYQELLEQIQKPLPRRRELPANVLAFERRINSLSRREEA